MENQDLKSTVLLEEHKALGAKLAPFGGWLMPIQYEGIIAEHNWTREKCSVFDICHMGEFMIKGDPIKSGLENIITARLSDMRPGMCRYGFMLDDNGGVIDDVVTYRISQDEWMLVVNAATTENDDAHLRRHLMPGTKMENVSAKLAKLDIQGPLSKDILCRMIDPKISELKYYAFGYFLILGEKNIVSRTGYTGELGYEIYISARKAVELWNKLLADPGIKPAGLGARDTLRLEMCYPLYGQDIDRNTSPLEAGFDRFVDLDKEFIGKKAILVKKHDNAKSRKLVCFITESRRSPRHNFKILHGSDEIGTVTSGSFSPSLSCGIGLGYINGTQGKIGKEIVLKENNIEINAKITDKPFYKKGTARK